MKTKALILFMALLGFMATSCQKSKPIEESSIEAADDAAFSETLFDDVFASVEIASSIAETMLKSASVTDTCPLITVTFPDQGFWPRSVVIDYGEGCTGINDIVRSGKINITITGPRPVAGSLRTVTLENYTCNDVKIEGTKTVENLGPNNAGNVVFSVTLADGKITMPDERFIERSFYREREYVAGYATWNPWDDECMITGIATGINLDGLAYTHTITNALHWTAVCRFIVSGTVRFDVEGIEPFDMDYGDGTCDAFATIIRGDETKEITLGFRHPKVIRGR
ncbi:MAG: hypothetical protein IH593_05625 [Bacteroidales bacterium]|nr:hypothetical protein [Bacteroidales bacterium]